MKSSRVINLTHQRRSIGARLKHGWLTVQGSDTVVTDATDNSNN